MSDNNDTIYAWPGLLNGRIAAYLQTVLSTGKLSHAYLFVGPEGSGKRRLAELCVQSIFCANRRSNGGTSIPCGACDHCRQFSKGIHPDFYELTLASDSQAISIDQIRELKQKLSLKTFLSQYKVVLLAPADRMNDEAANALLKTLEEPSGEAIIILLTEHLEMLPPTVVSRTQVINFLPITREEVVSFYNGSGMSEAAINSIYRLSGGLPEKIQSFLADDTRQSEYRGRLHAKIKLLSQPLTDSFLDNRERLSESRLYNDKLKILERDLNDWVLLFRDLLLVKSSVTALAINQTERVLLEKVAYAYTRQQLIERLNWLISRKNDLRYNPQPDLLLDTASLQLTV